MAEPRPWRVWDPEQEYGDTMFLLTFEPDREDQHRIRELGMIVTRAKADLDMERMLAPDAQVLNDPAELDNELNVLKGEME